ncbi:MAG: hypothetical protein AAF213_13205 [Pseudomonadota bacterium]
MITWADIIPLETGNIIIRVPEFLPEQTKLRVVVKSKGFAIYSEQEKVAQISNVEADIINALGESELLGILEWPQDAPQPDFLERYALVVDKRQA